VAFFADAKNGEFGADYAIFQPEFRHSATGGGAAGYVFNHERHEKAQTFFRIGLVW